AVEQRDAEALLQRADLAAHRRLAQVQRLARMGEAAGLGDRVEDAQLVPVHGHSAACAAAWPASTAARKRSASNAAMQPVPAAVTAWRNTLSCTSPAANTPGTRVRVEFGAATR